MKEIDDERSRKKKPPTTTFFKIKNTQTNHKLYKYSGIILGTLLLTGVIAVFHSFSQSKQENFSRKKREINRLDDSDIIYDVEDIEAQKETLLSTLVENGEDIRTISDVMDKADQVVNNLRKKEKSSETRVLLNSTVKDVFNGKFPSAYWMHATLRFNMQNPLTNTESVFKIYENSQNMIKLYESLDLTSHGLTYSTRGQKQGRNQKVLLGSDLVDGITEKLHYLTLHISDQLLEVYLDCQRVSRTTTLQFRHEIPKRAIVEAFVGKNSRLQVGSINILSEKLAKKAGVCCGKEVSNCKCLVKPPQLRKKNRKNPKPPKISKAESLAELGILKLPCEVSYVMGEKGEMGIPGADGRDGRRGKRGGKGRPGPAGRRGPRGPPGDCSGGSFGPKGHRGHIGRKGILGYPGETGKQGYQGETGQKGEPGIQGRPGKQGKRGKRGFRGSVGERGLPGTPGELGPVGPKGNEGQPGEPGARGYQGPPRDMPDLKQLVSRALEAQLPVILAGLKQECSRSCEALMLRKTHSQRGKAGIPGERGAPGEKGDKGNEGRNGVKGHAGRVGGQGIQGIPGEMGEKGDKGRRGKKVRGRPGLRGRPGPEGAPGFGIPGESGKQGEPGIAGPEGLQGELGRQGNPGVCDNKDCRAPGSWASAMARFANNYRKGPHPMDSKGPQIPTELGGPSLPQEPPEEGPGRRLPAETIEGNLLNIPQSLIPHLKGPDGQRHTINLEDWLESNMGMDVDEWRAQHATDPDSERGRRFAHSTSARRNQDKNTAAHRRNRT